MSAITPIFGFPYEVPGDQPGITLTGGQAGTHPILAIVVEQVLSQLTAGLGVPPTTQVFTTSGVYNKPEGLLWAKVRLVGGGGSGGGTMATGAGESAESAGGGGAEYAEGIFSAGVIATSETITVGAGGVGAVAGGSGNTGGTSSFGALITATGGTGGEVGVNTSVDAFAIHGEGGTGGTGGDVHIRGSSGGNGRVLGDSGGLATTSSQNFGGSSVLGGSRSINAVNFGGQTGFEYGGGSSGSAQNGSGVARPSSDGGAGIVIVEEHFV